ncbi:MAG TPA: methyltransferase domain-containing protein [Gillisia sp.]|nr:methyltransferase domain-containing protein [Gillisia sp.]
MKTNREFWDNRYREEATGWDIGEVSPPLRAYIDQLEDKNLKILIPGGGNSYEAEYLFSKGFNNVFVNDISERPLKNFRARVPSFPVSNLLLKDFFEIDQQFDLIIEQTFFCAIPVEKREAYVEKMHELLLPKGKLTGLLFNLQFEKEGPPFGGSSQEYINLFQKKFLIQTLEESYNSILPRQGNELFFIFIKN